MILHNIWKDVKEVANRACALGEGAYEPGGYGDKEADFSLRTH